MTNNKVVAKASSLPLPREPAFITAQDDILDGMAKKKDATTAPTPEEINKEKRKAVMRALLNDDMEITSPASPKKSYSVKAKVKSDKKGMTEFVEPEIMDLF